MKKLLLLGTLLLSAASFAAPVQGSDTLRVQANLREAILVTMGTDVSFGAIDVAGGRQTKATTITTATDDNTPKTLTVTHPSGNPDLYDLSGGKLRATFLNLGPSGSLANIDFIFDSLTDTTRTSFTTDLTTSLVTVGFTPVGTGTAAFDETFTFTVAYNAAP